MASGFKIELKGQNENAVRFRLKRSGDHLGLKKPRNEQLKN